VADEHGEHAGDQQAGGDQHLLVRQPALERDHEREDADDAGTSGRRGGGRRERRDECEAGSADQERESDTAGHARRVQICDGACKGTLTSTGASGRRPPPG